MKKLLMIAIVLALVVVAFYFFLLPKQPKTKNEIGVLLENLKEKTQIDFSKIKNIEFDWNSETEQGVGRLTIIGQSFQANNISADDYGKIEDFFKENNFEVDINNIADGTVAGLVGYRLDSMVCVVNSGFVGYREAEGRWTPSATDQYDITIKCGRSEKVQPIFNQVAEVKTIEADATENFFISLESNPTTGYQWEGDYDEEYLRFIGKEYVAEQTNLVGSGGNEVFNFVALKSGETEITFSYLRLWEMEPIEQTVYRIIVK